ncbi:MAG: small subunit ribosomal protein [Patescibacteria group bacterium]|nr:30S ribosomal protein S17 [Candidatus Saccharibacteria bacterium]MDQ5963437.1 small subunit ribosomal protein [Patescibacteria group bacterium]
MAKSITGVVSSNKTDKTIVVTVREKKTHPLYRKQYTTSKKIMAHDEKNEANVGDKVIIVETRPISRRKSFALETIVEKAGVAHVEAESGAAERAAKEATKEAKKAAEEVVEEEK